MADTCLVYISEMVLKALPMAHSGCLADCPWHHAYTYRLVSERQTFINERDEEGIYPITPQCATCRLYGFVRTTDHAQRGGYRVVSHDLYELHPTGIHGITTRRLAEIPATLRMWRLVGLPLDAVLW